MRKMKRVAVILAVVGLLVGSVHPKPTRASTEEDFIIAGAVLTAYVVVIVLATAVVYRNRPCFPPTNTDSDIDIDKMPLEHGVHFGNRCAQTSPNATLVCW
jgi:hypothetical protein